MSVVLDNFEYESDEICQAAYVTSDEYGPDVFTGGTVTTSDENPSYPATYAFDDNEATFYNSVNSAFPHWLKYDLGASVTKTARKLRIKPYRDANGGGVKNFTLAGSNNDSDWTDIHTDQHADDNAWEDYTFTNATAYRYYRISFADNWRVDQTITIVYEIEMMVVCLQCYSESTIVEEGTYSLEAIAKATDSLNDTLTRTIGTPIDLSGQTHIRLDIRASRTGSNVKIGIHDSGGTTTEHTANIASADTWQTEDWDISAVADVDKDAIDSIIITITNADSDNTFYLDDGYAEIQVSRERNIVYDSILALSKTRDIVYDSVLELSKTRDILYDSVLELSRERSIVYDSVLEVSRTRDIVYDSILELSKERDILYDLVLELSRERNIRYDLVLEVSKERNILYDLFELIQRLERPTGVWIKQDRPTDGAVKQERPTGVWIKQNKPS